MMYCRFEPLRPVLRVFRLKTRTRAITGDLKTNVILSHVTWGGNRDAENGVVGGLKQTHSQQCIIKKKFYIRKYWQTVLPKVKMG